jgi:hypothetical protein
MAAEYATMLDMANAMDPDGSIAAVAEVLHETNEALVDIGFVEGNLPTGHQVTIRTGLPRGTWRRLYQGVQPGKSKRAKITESCGMLEAYSRIDVREANLNGNSDAFMASENTAYIEGMGQDIVETLFYGNTALNPERFDGFTDRFNSLDGSENSENVIDAGGTGSDNRSVWLIGWGEQTCFGIVPKGSTAGLSIMPKGQQSVNDENSGTLYEAYVTHFTMDAGLCVKNWKYVVRICNIDISELQADVENGGANLPELMFQAIERIPSGGSFNLVFYSCRQVITKFRQQLASGTKNSTLEYKDLGGHRAAMWYDIPIRRVDKLAVDEQAVA